MTKKKKKRGRELESHKERLRCLDLTEAERQQAKAQQTKANSVTHYTDLSLLDEGSMLEE